MRTAVPETSILIPTKNGMNRIDSCLRAIFSQTGVGFYEVLAVDSGSTDGTLDVIRDYPARIVSIPSEEFHHARTRNYAASLAQGTVLVFLSQDAVPAHPGWLAALLRNFRDAAIGAAYGRQIPAGSATEERHEVLDAIYGTERLVKGPDSKSRLGFRYYHFSDANAAIRRDVWESTRFPEDLWVFEDLGIAKRILDAGWSIAYDPAAEVIHSHNHSCTQLFRRYFDIGYTFHRLGIWNGATQHSLAKEFVTLLKRRNRTGPNRRARSVAGWKRNVAKSLGFVLGANEEYLPLALKRHFSAYKVFH